MSTYLLTWNPSIWPWDHLSETAQRVRAGELVADRWSTGGRKTMAPGERFFILRQGVEPRGIVASGYTTSEVYRAYGYVDPEREENFVDIVLDAALDPDEHDPLHRADLDSIGDGKQDWDPQSSGTRIRSAPADELETRWKEYLGESGLGLVDPLVCPGRIDGFIGAYRRYLSDFVDSDAGQYHFGQYERQRRSGRENWARVREAAERGDDITDAVLFGLLPHTDSEAHREGPHWIAVIGGAIRGDVTTFYEAAGHHDADDWPEVAQAIYDFVRRCVQHPDELRDACDEFAASPQAAGFQSGMLSPILNVIAPDDFAIYNNKPRELLNYFTGQQIGSQLIDYPAANRALQELARSWSSFLTSDQKDDVPPSDLLDLYAHWLTAEAGYDLPELRPSANVRYWKIAPGRDAHMWDECLQEGCIMISRAEVGNICGISRQEYEARLDELLAQHGRWSEAGMEQLWRFVNIQEGDHVLANRGTSQVLGFGKVTGECYYQPGEFAHRLPVEWYDVTPRKVDEYGWRRTLIELDEEDFEGFKKAPTIDSDRGSTTSRPRQAEASRHALSEIAQDSGFDLTTLRDWRRAIERKGQIILYGPPGTGKTYLARKLAANLTAGDTDRQELIQFHPAYSYEDFIQGLRPEATEDGALTYNLVEGRFLQICDRAASEPDRPFVLIIDEINRANLAQVLGELMYLLEYRDDEVPLAGGRELSVPSNLRIIGTMNTADRSIALVDHALRRRFAFIRLDPNMNALRTYHRGTGFDVEGLIDVLADVNREIADPHYSVGVTFFMHEALADHIDHIWRMEIEPYLEEYFFNQTAKLDRLRWTAVQERIVGEAATT